MEINFPSDSDGFISCECPSCGERFKVAPGEGSNQPVSCCPHCGHRGSSCWLTPEQVNYAQSVVLSEFVTPELQKLQRSLSSGSTGFLKLSSQHNIQTPPPPPLEVDEPYDLVRFPCCNETVKLHRASNNFCVICGVAYDMKQSESKRIFLSHKGLDKEKVIDFKTALEALGFAPWLDDDAMPAGTSLERALLQGMTDSCAVVFFITPSFKDAGYLQTEVDYAIRQKRVKGEKFAIIALQFLNEKGEVGEIPELLKGYVWKTPKSDLGALREILRALPITSGPVDWREGIGGVVATPKAKSTVSELSSEAAAILLAAAKEGGTVMHSKFMGEQTINAGRKALLPDGEPRTVARWEGGLEDLIRRRYIKDVGHKGEVFDVTREGYDAADILERATEKPPL